MEKTVTIADLFDNPPPLPPGEPASVASTWDDDDGRFLDNLAEKAFAPAESLAPDELFGVRGWKHVVSSDAVTRGLAEFDRVASAWNWDMTPGQRARLAADAAFGDRIGDLIDSFARTAANSVVDPVEYAAGVLAERRA